jgi:hypothetical protein
MVRSEHDALRARLAQLDPMPDSVPVDPPTSPSAQTLLERAMLSTEPTIEPTTEPTTDTARPLWRRPALLAAAAAAVIAVGVGGVVAIGDGPGGSGSRPKTTLALHTQHSSGPAMGSCIVFSVDILKGMPLAFGGTVTQVGDGTVQITVDHWYKGGDADVVTIAVPARNTSVGTVDFVEGKRYLVTATEGTVNSCGYTGEATPDLVKAFDEAFTP